MRNNTISITTKKNSTRKINGTAKYDMTNLGYGSFPPIEIYKKPQGKLDKQRRSRRWN